MYALTFLTLNAVAIVNNKYKSTLEFCNKNATNYAILVLFLQAVCER